MKKTLPFLQLGLLPLAILVDYYEVFFCRNLISALCIYFILVDFLLTRHYAQTRIDKAYLIYLIVIFFSELIIGMIDSPITKIIINCVGFTISVNFLIQVFRLEGAIFPNRFDKKDSMSWLFSSIILVIFLIILPKIPNVLLFPSLLFLVQMTFLYWMAVLRPVENRNNWLVRGGILLFMFSQFWVLLSDYILEIQYSHKTLIYILLYLSAFYILNKGVMENIVRQKS